MKKLSTAQRKKIIAHEKIYQRNIEQAPSVLFLTLTQGDLGFQIKIVHFLHKRYQGLHKNGVNPPQTPLTPGDISWYDLNINFISMFINFGSIKCYLTLYNNYIMLIKFYLTCNEAQQLILFYSNLN